MIISYPVASLQYLSDFLTFFSKICISCISFYSMKSSHMSSLKMCSNCNVHRNLAAQKPFMQEAVPAYRAFAGHRQSFVVKNTQNPVHTPEMIDPKTVLKYTFCDRDNNPCKNYMKPSLHKHRFCCRHRKHPSGHVENAGAAPETGRNLPMHFI